MQRLSAGDNATWCIRRLFQTSRLVGDYLWARSIFAFELRFYNANSTSTPTPLNNTGYMLNENNIFSEEKYEVVELKRVLFEKLSRVAERQVLSVIFMSSSICAN